MSLTLSVVHIACVLFPLCPICIMLYFPQCVFSLLLLVTFSHFWNGFISTAFLSFAALWFISPIDHLYSQFFFSNFLKGSCFMKCL
jgi:hypothetical protein